MRSGSSAEARQTTWPQRAERCIGLQGEADAAKGEGKGTHLPCAATLRQALINPYLLRDLGLCCVNLGLLGKLMQLMDHRLVLAPEHSHIHVTPSIAISDRELQLLSIEKNYFPNARNES